MTTSVQITGSHAGLEKKPRSIVTSFFLDVEILIWTKTIISKKCGDFDIVSRGDGNNNGTKGKTHINCQLSVVARENPAIAWNCSTSFISIECRPSPLQDSQWSTEWVFAIFRLEFEHQLDNSN